jgi:hypothetical protein
VLDGRIVRWSDYWDLSLPRKMMTGEPVGALVPAHAAGEESQA